jgi:transposase
MKSILVTVYHLLSDLTAPYHELGPDYFEKHNKVRLAQQLVSRLQKLGFKITFEAPAA